MTILFDVTLKTVADGVMEESIYFIPVTASGVLQKSATRSYARRFGKMPDAPIKDLMVHDESALLICTGHHNPPSDMDDDENYDPDYINNPLVEFLRREHPEASLHEELRNRLASTERENERLEKENAELRRKLSALRDAFSE